MNLCRTIWIYTNFGASAPTIIIWIRTIRDRYLPVLFCIFLYFVKKIPLMWLRLLNAEYDYTYEDLLDFCSNLGKEQLYISSLPVLTDPAVNNFYFSRNSNNVLFWSILLIKSLKLKKATHIYYLFINCRS